MMRRKEEIIYRMKKDFPTKPKKEGVSFQMKDKKGKSKNNSLQYPGPQDTEKLTPAQIQR